MTSLLRPCHLKALCEICREFLERQKGRQMEIVSKLLLEDEQKKRVKKLNVPIIHPSARVTQSKALKRREQRLLQNLMPRSAHSEGEVKKNKK